VTRRAFAFVLALVMVGAFACSVPRDDTARIIENPEPDTSVPDSRPDGPRTNAKVYFVRTSDNKLEAVTTSVRVPAGPTERLEALIDGPQESRLESKFPRNTRFEVRSTLVEGERIVILNKFDPTKINREALILAFQQIVFTLTELPDVNSVQFSVNNAPYKVPLRNGDKETGVGVRRWPDYELDSIYTTTTAPPPSTTAPPSSTTAPTTSGPPGAGPAPAAPGGSGASASAPPPSSAPS
jgi:hypothetical protein